MFGRAKRNDSSRSEDRLEFSVPVAANPRFVTAAVLFGAPWLLAMVVGTVVFLVAVPIHPWLIRLLAWIVAIGFFVFMHVLAFMAVWGAFYQARGTETVIIDAEQVQVLRTAAGITLPARIGRLGVTHVEVLPPWYKKAPQPKIEVKTGKGAVRFGAGISHGDAEELVRRIQAYLSAEDEARALTERHDLR